MQRAEAALALAECETLDPASRLIIRDAAWRAAFAAPRLVGEESNDPEQRGLAESDLTRALRAGLGDREEQRNCIAVDPQAAEELSRLAQSHYRVELARRFHNDAVTQIQHIRRTIIVRNLHLAGRAPMPQTFEMDEALHLVRRQDDPEPRTGP